MADRGISRRQLIQSAGAVALGGTAVLRAQPPERKVGWAILGLGSYARNQILPNMRFCERSQLKALISGSPDKAKQVAQQYGIPESKIYNYENLERIKDDPDIDVVYVITPPGTHKEFTVRSLRSGKHVCCEKPMAYTAAEAVEMVAEAKKAERRLQIGYRCHFEPHNLRAMELCRSGEMGQIRTIRSEHAFTMTWDGGWHSKRGLGGYGAITEIGIYSIQALCYLAGTDPIEIVGSRHKLDVPRFREVEDFNEFILVFPNGIHGSGATGYSFNANNFRVQAERGRLDAENATSYSGHRYTFNGRPVEVPPANQWARQMDHLSECVLDPTKKLIAPGEMGLRDMRIVEAILRSADEGRKPIRLQ